LLENLSCIIIGNRQKNWSGSGKKCVFSSPTKQSGALKKSFVHYFLLNFSGNLNKKLTDKNTLQQTVNSGKEKTLNNA